MRTAYETEFPELLECHRVTGQDSMVMKVAVRSMAHLENLLDRLTTYGTSTTSMVLSTPVEARVISREMAEGQIELFSRRR
jgi:Lrp/AsnC family leucine-responsive transcriptional regulator